MKKLQELLEANGIDASNSSELAKKITDHFSSLLPSSIGKQLPSLLEDKKLEWTPIIKENAEEFLQYTKEMALEFSEEAKENLQPLADKAKGMFEGFMKNVKEKMNDVKEEAKATSKDDITDAKEKLNS